MTNGTTLPHERLIAFQVARKLLLAVRDAGIRDGKLRDQAMRAAKGACLNIAEAAGRQSGPDKARVYAIARGAASEAAAALDIAALVGDCDQDRARVGASIARRLYALLTGLIRA